MGVVLHWTVQLQQRQIIFKGGRIILPMDDDSLHILRHRTLALQVAGDIELAHNGYQRGQESAIYPIKVRNYLNFYYFQVITYPG